MSLPRILGPAGLLVLALALTGVAVAPTPVQADPCTTMSLNGDRRPCTPTEEFTRCVTRSYDAYWQCRRNIPGKTGALLCAAFFDIDFIFCFSQTGIGGVIRVFTRR